MSKPASSRRPTILAIVIGCACLPSFAAHQVQDGEGTTRIELQAQVDVSRPQVTLGDVAVIEGPAGPALQRLAALPLGEVSRGGEAVTLEQAALGRWIRARLGLDAARIVWSGPPASHVRLATQAVAGEKIGVLAQDRLRAALRASGLRAEVDLGQTPPDVKAPQGRLELKVRPPLAEPVLAGDSAFDASSASARALLAKRQSVWVDVWVDGRFVRTVPVSLEVSVFGPAYVAARDMKMGQAVGATTRDGDGLVVRDVEWSGRSSAPLLVSTTVAGPAADRSAAADAATSQALADGVPMRLRRAVGAGQALTHADVEPMPWVVRGDSATLHVIQGAIDLESRVEVLQDGIAGQAVRVRRASGGATIVARVTGPGQVEVRE